jgi:hypothetical protein
MADHQRMLEYVEKAIKASAMHSGDAIRSLEDAVRAGRDATEAAISLARLDDKTREQIDQMLGSLRDCGVAHIKARAGRLSTLLSAPSAKQDSAAANLAAPKRWWQLWRSDPENEIERHVGEFTRLLDHLGPAPLSEEAYHAEVEKFVMHLAQRNANILREVLARAEAIYDERMKSVQGKPFAIMACRDTVRKLRKQWP